VIPEPLPDIRAQVREHAYRAMVLSEIEDRPPGYTKTAWAVLLMDNDYDRLLTRFIQKVAAKRAIHEQMMRDADGYADAFEGDHSFLPAVPKNPPSELAAKSREVHRKWLGVLVEQECRHALQSLIGHKMDDKTLWTAQGILDDTLKSLTAQVDHLPYTAKVTMNQDGNFSLSLHEKPPRRSLR